MTKESEVLAALQARFPIEDIEEVQGFYYVGIDQTLARLNTVCGMHWGLTIIDSKLEALGDGRYFAQMAVRLGIEMPPEDGDPTARWVYERDGVGAAVMKDPDNAYKTAQAYALRKAGNQFGIAGYLWDADELKILKLAKDGNYKGAVGIRARKDGVPLTADPLNNQELLAEFYGCDVTIEENLKKIIVEGKTG